MAPHEDHHTAGHAAEPTTEPAARRTAGAAPSLSRRRFTAGATTAAAVAGLAAAAPAAPAAPAAAPGAPSPEPSATAGQAALAVARAILLLDEDGTELAPRYEKVLRGGLPRSGAAATGTPGAPGKEVLVVGAGPAGLVTALLLGRAGHRVTVVEANGNRAGGRIKTFRTGGHERAEQPFADPKQYAEAGAMRIPGSHPLVMGLIDELGLKRRRFHLVDVDADGRPAYRTWIAVNGVRMRRADYAKNPRAVNRSFGVPEKYLDTPAAEILDRVLDPVRDEYSTVGPDGKRVNKPLPQCLEGWTRVVRRFGGWSMHRFLTEHAGFDERTIDLIGTLENLTSRLPLSFLHSFIGWSLINPGTVFWELEGGTATLADALLKELEGLKVPVRFDRRATRVEYRGEGRRGGDGTPHIGADGPAVWIDTVSEGRDGAVVREQFTGDCAVLTVPFSGLRQIQVAPPLSYGKRRAVTELHYDSATKVLLEFSRRWWEFDEADWRRELERVRPGLYDAYRLGRAPDDGSLLGAHPSVPRGHISDAQRVHYTACRWISRDQPEAAGVTGGGSVCDNPNRFMFNPSHRVEGSEGGVLLASYSWADDARRWDCLDDEARYPYALRGVQQVYGQRVEVFYTGAGRTQSWQRDPYAYGEAAVLLPGQHTELFPLLGRREGPLFFAGDHTSIRTAWIEGALESAVRTALEVHRA
ncbi:FAD-dependent oxidoreductase [Streptomyces sp. S1A]|uniref:flavin monoamine oxidase family protein n=1 Tax=Streptomyces sp. ICN903 TaxID=2964654 RepID=UPI001EDA2E14|nr:FAD-dependent oxidoreductase [Streptomyces sp. ICN903]MCG3040102.1 FAD-dependent oxidoreductase [Streptomyces sp. ICN903]